ncbi:MAG: hypothetical protein ABSD68_03720 [Candidatus Micrarchaeales archaeon]|jgi:hypothetical protein
MSLEINKKASFAQLLEKINEIQMRYKETDPKQFATEIADFFQTHLENSAESKEFKEKLRHSSFGTFILWSEETLLESKRIEKEINSGNTINIEKIMDEVIENSDKVIRLTENKNTSFEKLLRIFSLEIAENAYGMLYSTERFLSQIREQEESQIENKLKKYSDALNAIRVCARIESTSLKYDMETSQANEWIDTFVVTFSDTRSHSITEGISRNPLKEEFRYVV